MLAYLFVERAENVEVICIIFSKCRVRTPLPRPHHVGFEKIKCFELQEASQAGRNIATDKCKYTNSPKLSMPKEFHT